MEKRKTGLKIPLGTGKVKLSLYRPWRPLGLREVEAPTFSDIRLKMVARLSALRAGRFLTPERFLILIFVRGWVDPRARVWLEGQLKKKSNDLIGNRNRGIPACSVVPQPTTLPRAPSVKYITKIFNDYWKTFSHARYAPQLLKCNNLLFLSLWNA
jgi:hypothetical protein